MINTELISIIVSIIGLTIGVIAFILTIAQEKKGKAFVKIDVPMKGEDKVIDSSKSFLKLMGISLRPILRSRKLLEFAKANPHISIKLLVLDPNSLGAQQYFSQEELLIEHVKRSLSEMYQENLIDANQQLKEFSNIEVRLYSVFPNGYFFISDKLCLLKARTISLFGRMAAYKIPFILVDNSYEEGKKIYDSSVTIFDFIWEQSRILMADTENT
jgi:hypothetical protein